MPLPFAVLNDRPDLTVDQPVIGRIGCPPQTVIPLGTLVRTKPDIVIRILVDGEHAARQPVLLVEHGPSPIFQDRIGRGDLERVHGVGRNCPQAG